ncbi:MAG: DNA-directed RNA polymerase subunit omega [Deltaproteobacteria bacterium]|nr:DNA-directed RNA polymerase subunit omega [Deltaproteobacteria bacterium]HCH61225.1 DNA-directed RNA polymerase subunit omega [Deltaproteobacteria bacterium]
MARVTVEDCLEELPNRFSLVLVAAERTRQLLKGSEPLVDNDQGNKEAVLSLREIAASRVGVDLSLFDENEGLRTFAGPVSREDLPPADAGHLPPAADDDFALPPAADDDFGLPPAADDFDLPPEA